MGLQALFKRTPGYAVDRRRDSAVDELIGLTEGMLADGDLNSQEVTYLAQWLTSKAEFANDFPFCLIIDRLSRAMADGRIDADEERDLIATMQQLSGNANAPATPGAGASTALPLDDPAPRIWFDGRSFVVTGTFAYGTREAVLQAIQQRGGIIRSSVSKSTEYLVIGTVGSDAWMHSSYGRKIEAAASLRARGVPICIVCEQHWHGHL